MSSDDTRIFLASGSYETGSFRVSDGFRFSAEELTYGGATSTLAFSTRGGLLKGKALLVASTAGGGREWGGGCDIGRGDAETSCLRYEGCESVTAACTGGTVDLSLLGLDNAAGCRLVISNPL